MQRRAEVHDTYISRVSSPQNVCRSLSVDLTQAQADTRPLMHKANRLVTRVLKLSLSVVRRRISSV